MITAATKVIVSRALGWGHVPGRTSAPGGRVGRMGLGEQELDAFAQWEREAWEARAQPYAADVTAYTQGAAKALLDATGVQALTRVLDVATGPGLVADLAVRRRAQVTAVDQSVEMVALASRNVRGAEVLWASAEALPFEDGSFHAVVAGFLLNHLARPIVGVREMARVLSPGGRLAMTVWDVPAKNRATGLIGELITEMGVTGVVPPGPDSTQFADGARFQALLQEAGLVFTRIARPTWELEVEPGAWFDVVAAAMPRSGAVLAAAGPEARGAVRERFVEVATSSYGVSGGRVALPAAAVLGVGAKPEEPHHRLWRGRPN